MNTGSRNTLSLNSGAMEQNIFLIVLGQNANVFERHFLKFFRQRIWNFWADLTSDTKFQIWWRYRAKKKLKKLTHKEKIDSDWNISVEKVRHLKYSLFFFIIFRFIAIILWFRWFDSERKFEFFEKFWKIWTEIWVFRTKISIFWENR